MKWYDRQTDRPTDRQTDWTIHRAAWTQFKIFSVSIYIYVVWSYKVIYLTKLLIWRFNSETNIYNHIGWYDIRVYLAHWDGKYINFTSRETWQLSNEPRWISANIDALPCTVNCQLLLERSAWTRNNKTCVVHCLLNGSFWETINRFVKL